MCWRLSSSSLPLFALFWSVTQVLLTLLLLFSFGQELALAVVTRFCVAFPCPASRHLIRTSFILYQCPSFYSQPPPAPRDRNPAPESLPLCFSYTDCLLLCCDTSWLSVPAFPNTVLSGPLLEWPLAHLCANLACVFPDVLTRTFTNQLPLGLWVWPAPNLTHSGVPHRCLTLSWLLGGIQRYWNSFWLNKCLLGTNCV